MADSARGGPAGPSAAACAAGGGRERRARRAGRRPVATRMAAVLALTGALAGASGTSLGHEVGAGRGGGGGSMLPEEAPAAGASGRRRRKPGLVLPLAEVPFAPAGAGGPAEAHYRRLQAERQGILQLEGATRAGGYFATELAIGNPPRNFSLIVDTGST